MNTVAQLCKLPKEDEKASLNKDSLLICYGSSIKQARSNKKYQKTTGTQLAFGTNKNKIQRNGRLSFRPFYDINYSQIDKNIKVTSIKENPNLNQEFQRIKNNRSHSVKKDSINTYQIIHQRRVSVQSYKIKNKIQFYGDDKLRNNFRLPMNTKELNDSLFTILQKYQVPKKCFNLMEFSI